MQPRAHIEAKEEQQQKRVNIMITYIKGSDAMQCTCNKIEKAMVFLTHCNIIDIAMMRSFIEWQKQKQKNVRKLFIRMDEAVKVPAIQTIAFIAVLMRCFCVNSVLL